MISPTSLRSLIRQIISEDAGPSAEVKGGTHAFHGNKFSPDSMGLPGPRFKNDEPVSEEDLDAAEEWLAEKEPDRIIAYSRGSAVLNKLAQERPEVDIPEVIYVAPAAKRDAWGTKGVSAPSVSGRVIASTGDGAVPVKQACMIAQEAGIPIYLVPGEFKSDNWESEGMKNHLRVLKHKNASSGIEVDASACLASGDLPDWGSGYANKEMFEKQFQALEKLTGLSREKIVSVSKNESINRMRMLIRELTRHVIVESFEE